LFCSLCLVLLILNLVFTISRLKKNSQPADWSSTCFNLDIGVIRR